MNSSPANSAGKLLIVACVAGASIITAVNAQEALQGAAPRPLRRAHAHNDYEHPRPLWDALQQGFCSVEADVYVDGKELLVAHDRPDVRPERTLRRLYLQPLQKRCDENDGRVFRKGPEFSLLIDFKSAARPTYDVLRQQLEPYREMLTRVERGQVVPGAVRIVISGNRPTQTVAREADRLVFIDGRLPDLERRPPADLVCWISDRWTSHFRWRGEGPFPQEERERLHDYVRTAHRQGRRVRFWATPEQESVWRALLDADVDLINTDDLAGLAEFLRRHDRTP